MIEIQLLISLIKQAGCAVMLVYEQSTIAITTKADNSILTIADGQSHTIICTALEKLYPEVPIISEESATHQNYQERKNWEYCFLVDPLDGTKEFVQRNGEFTINIALIKNQRPVVGIIHVPMHDITYYAEIGKGAYKIQHGELIQLLPQPQHGREIRVVVSRSHGCMATEKFLQNLANSGKDVTTVIAGSALKFGLVAEGKADLYPRHTPTMEWDTAAGQIIVNEVGKKVMSLDDEEELRYNKANLLNPGFIVR